VSGLLGVNFMCV